MNAILFHGDTRWNRVEQTQHWTREGHQPGGFQLEHNDGKGGQVRLSVDGEGELDSRKNGRRSDPETNGEAIACLGRDVHVAYRCRLWNRFRESFVEQAFRNREGDCCLRAAQVGESVSELSPPQAFNALIQESLRAHLRRDARRATAWTSRMTVS